MALEQDERPPLDDTVDISSETTQTDEAWPVAEHYLIEPPDPGAGTELEQPAAAAAVEQAQPPANPRRPFARNLGLVLLAVAAALFLAGAVAWFVADDSGTAATGTVEGAKGSSHETTTATPTTSEPVDLEKPLPDLTGVSLAEAAALLERAGLQVRIRKVTSDRPKGEIVGQDPAAGTRLGADSVVVLVVSRGNQSEITKAPNLVGLRASVAARMVRRVGLQPQLRLVVSTRPKGTIVSQKPSGGAEVMEGSTVRLDVAKAPPAIQVPDVVGSTKADARSRLRALGLTSTGVPVTSSEAAGTVVGQSPRAGAKLRKGATVTLRVSTGPALTSVPDVTGLDEASARAELQGAGFEVRVVYEPTTDPTQDGIVARQDPAGGTSADEGAVVTITVFQLG